MVDKYIDPLTDYGFKKLFGSEPNKEILIELLNALLPDDKVVEDVEFRNSEWMGENNLDRRAYFDLYCYGSRGERFIVELQRLYQKHFKDRCLYYSTFPIQRQGVKGDWNFELTPVYTVAFLDYEFRQEDTGVTSLNDYVHVIELRDAHGNVFYDKYMQIYIELPKFRKDLKDLSSSADRWLYFLRNARELREQPECLTGKAFDKVFEEARLSAMTTEERTFYEHLMRNTRDIRNAIISAEEEAAERGYKDGQKAGLDKGIEQGIEEGLQQGLEKGQRMAQEAIARAMLKSGIPIAQIVDVTSLSADDVARLRSELS